MQKIFMFLCLCSGLTATSQEFIPGNHMDTLRVGDVDSIVSFSYSVKGVVLDVPPKLIVKVAGGSAKQGTDFKLLDAYGSGTSMINITHVENLKGKFSIKIAGGLSSYKVINLRVDINDNNTIVQDIARIVIGPLAKKPMEPIKPLEEPKNDSLVFEYYNDINVELDTLTKDEKEYKSFDKVNISSIDIKQRKSFEYMIRVTTMDNAIYFGIIQLTTDGRFDDRSILYLNGDRRGSLIFCQSLLIPYVQLKGEKSAETKNKLYKFKL